MSNPFSDFKNISEAFLAKSAAVRVDNGSELVPVLHNLLADEKRRRMMGLAAKQVVLENRGATEQSLNEISRFLHA